MAEKLNRSGNKDLDNSELALEAGRGRFSFSVNVWKEFHKEETSKFGIYFTIILDNYTKQPNENYYVFRFSIVSNIYEGLKVIIEKRYSDFVALVAELKKTIIANPPPLPKKTLMHDEAAMKMRGTQLEEWLTVISNEKMFHSQLLFKFMNIPHSVIASHLNFPSLSFTKRIICRIQNYSCLNTQEENFVVYNIKIDIIDSQTKQLMHTHFAGRRFREFCNLHDIVKMKFKNYKLKLPDIPKGRGILVGALTNESRLLQLEAYLKNLLLVDDILEVLYFRKFLNLETEVFKGFPQTKMFVI